MKFIDGFWLLKNGVKPYYALQVVKVDQQTDGYELQVSTKPIRHRGDTLGGPVLTIKVHSPTEGVVGVKIDHFNHSEPTVNIPLFPNAKPIPNVNLSKAGSDYTLSTAGLNAVITENPYTITFKSPKQILTSAGPKHQGVFDVPSQWTLSSASNSSCLATDIGSNPNPEPLPPIIRYINSELNLSPGELIYGFGEQFGSFVKNGQTVKIWNQDGGTSSDQAYKCVPFYLTNRNYGVFINHPGEVEVEVGSEKVSRVGVSVAGSSLEYFIIYGETPLQILERYTRMTGRPPVLPSWTFGLWLSTSFLTSYSSETVSGFLQGMQDRDVPVRVFHLDCFWMKQYEWCSFTFDPDNFPDPKGYLSEIKRKFGVKICVWINPYISQLSPIFKEGITGGYFIQRTDGTPWQWDLWQPGLAIVDFTNPKACEWYLAKLNALIDIGVDCFKTDFAERIPHASVKYFDGSDPMRMHNMYSIIYNELVFNLLRDRLGEGEAVLFARASFAGGQRFPVHWGGDCESTWEAMAEAMRGCLSLTLSGFAFASHDIGGFEAIQSTETGHPMQRAMFLEFPEDRNTHYLDRQFMMGPSLLVAPVFVPQEEETEYYIPAGRWTNFWDHSRTVVGPIWIKERVALDEIPVWVRPGTLLLRGPPNTGRPDYDYGKDLRVELFDVAEGETLAKVPGGVVIRADRQNGKIKVTIIEGKASINSIFSVGAGGKERVVKVDSGATEIVCELV
ncbi:alpha-glucosidase [Lentinula lateritia]|uniref:Alpha-glucosidase n=1 Tax=Lentinula lateritia TaxID=40482 RepID=A0ABQ8VZ18_9AGAR|nr:alpha-glucosidase [Lentinula lateritia]